LSYAIEFVPRAWKELHALPDEEAARIESRIRLLADDPRANAVKLAGEENLWRIRIRTTALCMKSATPSCWC
jgi:mRNA-degrading endonuclease RelE of RelBE toxin-antitoxin system